MTGSVHQRRVIASVLIWTMIAALEVLTGCGQTGGQFLDVGLNQQSGGQHSLDAGSSDAGARDGGSLDAGRSDAGVSDAGANPSGPTPQIFEQFSGWTGNTSPDGIWRIAGVWTGSGGNTLDPNNASFSPSYGGATGVLLLTSKANTKSGAEIQSLSGYGFGYYEVSMKVSPTSGVCDSFFWIEAPNYGPGEIDVEFLTNESWIDSPDQGQVHFTLHPSEQTYVWDLPFNPSKAFHRYGFLWQSGRVDFTVDGQTVHTFLDSDLSSPTDGFIMMNTWTGNPSWGGGPPTTDAVTAYDQVKFYPGITAVPAG